MRDVLRAEWTKLHTTAGTAWLFVAAVVLTVAGGAVAAAAVSCPSGGCGIDPAKTSLTGVYLGQAAVVVVAVLLVGDEYATGMIRTTFAAIPHRLVVLVAKAMLLIGTVLAAGAVAVAGSMLAGQLILGGHGIAPALSPSDVLVLRAAGGSVLYFALVALLGLGVATAVRNSAAAVGITLGLLYVFPIIAGIVRDPTWQRHLEQIAPMSAGLSIQNTLRLGDQPIGPWTGLGVLAAWAAGSVLLGGLVVRLRDS